MTTTESDSSDRPQSHRLKHFCLVVSTVAGVATPVIALLAYLQSIR
jgi:hypothetical protein